MSAPIFDADVLALQGWTNREGIIPPSGQQELRESVGRLLNRLNEQQAEIERLRAIVDKLPKTADGAPAYPGMALWGWNEYLGEIRTTHCLWLSIAGLYSSRAALESALRQARDAAEAKGGKHEHDN